MGNRERRRKRRERRRQLRKKAKHLDKSVTPIEDDLRRQLDSWRENQKFRLTPQDRKVYMVTERAMAQLYDVVSRMTTRAYTVGTTDMSDLIGKTLKGKTLEVLNEQEEQSDAESVQDLHQPGEGRAIQDSDEEVGEAPTTGADHAEQDSGPGDQ